MEETVIEDENEVKLKENRIMCGIMDSMVEKKSINLSIDMNKESGEHQNQDLFDSSYSAIKDNKSDNKSKAKLAKNELNSGYSNDSWSEKSNEVSKVSKSPNNDKKGENYSEIYNNYYANYYQHCGVKGVCPETNSSQIRGKDMDSKSRSIDSINKGFEKQQHEKKNRNDSKRSTSLEVMKTDEDVEEGQIPSSPRAMSKGYSSSSTPSKASSPSTPLDSSTRNSQYDSSKSMSRSVSKERLMKSRSRSRSRRRFMSRSRSRSLSRQRRRRSRSRSPYLGPIIKDYRRGRRGFVRYPRGFRDRGMRSFRRGHHSQHHYFPHSFSRRQEFSRSRSRSFSPKRRQVDAEKSAVNSDEEEKQFDPKRSDTLKPSDINMSQKRITQSFLAMLEEKQNRSKMVPIEANRSFEMSESDENFNKQHGFVNTFNTVREMDARKHTLSYDLEREGWQVIDDANSESAPKRRLKNRDEDIYEEKFKDLDHSYNVNEMKEFDIKEKMAVKEKMKGDSSSSDEFSKKKKKKKTKKRKKKKKRKASTSSDSSDSEYDNENAEDLLDINKKKTKKKKKSKKKKKVVSSSSSSENEDKEEKRKKKKKKKKKDSSSDSESETKIDDMISLSSNQKLLTEGSVAIGSTPSIASEIIKDGIKTKDKKKKKRKTETSDSSDSDSDENEKKKKKKNKKKKSRKRKHRSSSSSSSTESSDSSESGERKKKKRKKSKKTKKSRKHKKEKKSEKKEKNKMSSDDKKKSKHTDECKQSEFVTVYSIGSDPPLELKWPKKLIKYTICEPSLQFSTNPKVPFIEDDFRQIKDERNKIIEEMLRKRQFVSEFGSDNDSDVINIKKDSNEKLAAEYNKFMDELTPLHAISEESIALESKMRDQLLKQYQIKNDSEEQYSVTPSEKRAIERIKKQQQITSDENEDHRRHQDLKSVPLSTYYSSKKQSKSSPSRKSEDSEKSIHVKSSNKSSESESYNKPNDISLSTNERIHKHESQTSENLSKNDDKKKTVRELLERVKQKKHSGKESESKDDSNSNRRIPQIGKMKKPLKKCLTRTPITTVNADSTQTPFVSQPMKLDMNYDYNWYYKYYMNSYAFGQYPNANSSSLAAAYYAQYAMVTSFDYKQSDLSNWMNERGYTIDNNYYVMADNEQNVNSNQQLIHSNEIQNSSKTQNILDSNEVESSATELISAKLSIVESEAIKPEAEFNELIESIPMQENTSKTSQNDISLDLNNEVKNEIRIEKSHNEEQNIETVVSAVHSGIVLDQLNKREMKNETESSPNMSPFSSAKFKHKVKVRVTTSSQNDNESEDCVSPPPPPPPPLRPEMTTFTSREPITLPNGQVLPSGTKQIVVHPYQTNDSFKFTSDWFYNAFNAHNSTTTTTPASAETQGVVKAN